MNESTLEGTNEESPLTEEYGKRLITFNYKGRVFDVRQKLIPLKENNVDKCRLTVLHGNEEHGIINGKLKEENEIVSFKSTTMRNVYFGRTGHVKGLITHTITQLILDNIIDKWVSSNIRSKEANKVYRKLDKNKKLVVEKNHPNDPIRSVFVVTFKPQNINLHG